MNWLRDNWMPIAAIALLAAYGWSSGAKDQPAHHPFIFTDAFTGKQYVVNPAGGIWPQNVSLRLPEEKHPHRPRQWNRPHAGLRNIYRSLG